MSIVPSFSTSAASFCEFQIEGVRGDTNLWGGYTVDEVYGLVGSAWMPVHYGEGTETGVKEDYNFALDKARGADAIEAHGSDEPVSLKAAVKEAREASVALAGMRSCTMMVAPSSPSTRTSPM